jgi:hypothetical protein
MSPERFFVLLSAGNLAHHAGGAHAHPARPRVRSPAELSRPCRAWPKPPNISAHINSRTAAQACRRWEKADHAMTATFILGGQISRARARHPADLSRGQLHPRLEPDRLPADRRTQVRQADPRSAGEAGAVARGHRARGAAVHGRDHAQQRDRRGAHRGAHLRSPQAAGPAHDLRAGRRLPSGARPQLAGLRRESRSACSRRCRRVRRSCFESRR